VAETPSTDEQLRRGSCCATGGPGSGGGPQRFPGYRGRENEGLEPVFRWLASLGLFRGVAGPRGRVTGGAGGSIEDLSRWSKEGPPGPWCGPGWRTTALGTLGGV